MTTKILKGEYNRFRLCLEKLGFKLEQRPNQIFLARRGKCVVSLYNTGSVVIAGAEPIDRKEIEFFVSEMTSPAAAATIEPEKDLLVHGPRVGSDEVGKGDYFGPLVICAVFADDALADRLSHLGVRDSKQLGDTAIRRTATEIRRVLHERQFRVVTIPPIRYNILHREMRNVNRILGWGHARALEDVLALNPRCRTAIADQFGDESYIENRLFAHGQRVELRQFPRAEREISVAAASILAREQLLRSFDDLGLEYNEEFPKGASSVEPFAKALVGRFGPAVLVGTAKLHFSTTQRVTDGRLDDLKRDLEDVLSMRGTLEGATGELGETSYLELFNLISSFEKALRDFLAKKLEEHFGHDWWNLAIAQAIRDRAVAIHEQDQRNGRNSRLIDCLEFSHYAQIITREGNWQGLFDKVFGNKNLVSSHLEILREVRNPVEHHRRLRRADKLSCLGGVSFLREKMGLA